MLYFCLFLFSLNEIIPKKSKNLYEPKFDSSFFPQLTDNNPLTMSIEEKNFYNASTQSDPIPKSEDAFVAVYSGDDKKYYQYLQMILVLGYNLQLLDPTTDRIVLIPDDFKIPEKHISYIKKFWTHIIYRPQIIFPPNVELTQKEKSHFFRLQAWTISGYKKISLLGADILFLCDHTIFFRNGYFPSSSFALESYKMQKYGTNHNTDYIFMQPNANDYIGLISHAIQFLNKSGSSRSSFNEYGQFEAAVINYFFGSRFSTIPIQFLGENAHSSFSTFIGNPYQINKNLKIGGFHMGRDRKPFDYNIHHQNSIYIQLWKMFAKKFFQKYNIPFQISNAPEGAESFVQSVKYSARSTQKIKNDDDFIKVYPNPSVSQLRNVFSKIFLALFILLLVFGYSFSFQFYIKSITDNIENNLNQYTRVESL